MTAIAFVFPGQGSQSIGMMDALAADFPVVRRTFDDASDVLGEDLWTLVSEGPEERLNQTEITQPAMLAADMATWRIWRELEGAEPDVLAGHSLGEYAALVAAGVLSFRDTVQVVAARGRFMQQATPEGTGAMAAILGLEDEALVALCNEVSDDESIVSCANFNAPGQVVIAGHADAVERACEAARGQGARRVVPLPVSVPSHCVLMKPAAEELAEMLEAIDFAAPNIPVLQNADVVVHKEVRSMREALVRQLWMPVRWTDTVQAMLDQGIGRFAECGPGRVLAGLGRRMARDAEHVALTDPESVREAVQEWNDHE